jgi:hypothetical protein
MAPPLPHRAGKFIVPLATLLGDERLARQIFDRMIVLSAVPVPVENNVQFLGLHPGFDECDVDPHFQVPYYKPRMDLTSRHLIGWERIP